MENENDAKWMQILDILLFMNSRDRIIAYFNLDLGLMSGILLTLLPFIISENLF